MRSELFGETYTIVNQIPSSSVNAAKVLWKMRRLTQCGKRDGLWDKSSDTMIYHSGSWTVRCREWHSYKKPSWNEGGYYSLSDEDKPRYYTVSPGDLIIFGEISDAEPDSLSGFNALRDKYRDSGGIITGSEVFIHYYADGSPWITNHIKIIKG